MYVKQAANTLEVLEFFAEVRRPATVAEIASKLGWPRSSTFNLIGTLVDKGYLYEPQSRNGYYPSPRWLDLSEEVSRWEPMPADLIGLTSQLAAETGETAIIGAFAGVKVMFIHVVESQHGIRYHARVGHQVPVHASSVGRALLAQIPKADREALYRKIHFEEYSKTTPMSAPAVEGMLAAAEERGYHQSDSEYEPDLAGVALALPVTGRRLSIVIVGPVSRCRGRRGDFAMLMKKHINRLPSG